MKIILMMKNQNKLSQHAYKKDHSGTDLNILKELNVLKKQQTVQSDSKHSLIKPLLKVIAFIAPEEKS
jgi:hypothetical protein